MPDKKKAIDPIPETFATEEEAGEFWDTHSLTDYEEFLEPADFVFELSERVFEVRVTEDMFEKLQKEAKTTHKSVPKVVDQILRKGLTPA